ncbi:ABC transporter substrate-binding protein [Ramlibacter tataouinensis]|uniref:ABC transporter substrate-binding protein n=1 Tax=Ramlibacter tataouinensis TaxID=94132 RepID=UPI0022F3847D|nr:ABC transporter substrate-binding protein [Ramlibacter tataouinensis]WBY03013.1 ABC transporter substrate-binding protein [Ramlibacter tataouinensis]
MNRLAVVALGLGLLGPAAMAQEKISLRLDWAAGGWQAPILLAHAKGLYKSAGLNVEINEGKGSLNTLQLVGRGNDQIGHVDGSSVLRGAANGVPVTAVAVLYRKNLMSIAVREDAKVNSPQELAGKSLTTTAGDAQSAMLPAYLAHYKLDGGKVKVNAVDGGAKYRMVIAGNADGVATFGGLGVPLMQGMKGGAEVRYKSFDFADAGINLPGFCLIVNNSFLEKNGEQVRKFVLATAEAWKSLQANPEQAVDEIVQGNELLRARRSEFVETVRNLNAYVHTARSNGKPFGWMAPEDWRDAEQTATRVLDLKFTGKPYYTNRFVE